MRLRDADALIDYFGDLPGTTIAITDVQAIIDNAPDVACAECEHETNCEKYTTVWDGCEDKEEPTLTGCSNFKAKP